MSIQMKRKCSFYTIEYHIFRLKNKCSNLAFMQHKMEMENQNRSGEPSNRCKLNSNREFGDNYLE